MNKKINKIITNLENCFGIFDYSLTPTESNLLVLYLKELQQENKKLKENAENNGKLVDKVKWENMLLKKENQELKSKLELYKNGVYFSSEVDEKDKQIDKLKKKYENAVADYEKIEFEKEQLNSLVNSCQEVIRQLKKQLENYKKLRFKHLVDKNNNLENQQKEFIKYLEDEIKLYKNDIQNFSKDYNVYFSLINDLRVSKAKIEEILQKYKSIIGVSDENNIK